MKKIITKILERSPEHYPPISINQIDFDYDEMHPWKRFFRQNAPQIKLLTFFDLSLWLYAFFHSTAASYLVAIGSTLIFLWLLLDEKNDDETRGHLRPNHMGDYWRARMGHFQSNKHEFSENNKK